MSEESGLTREEMEAMAEDTADASQETGAASREDVGGEELKVRAQEPEDKS